MKERIKIRRLLWPVGIALLPTLPLVTFLSGCGSGGRTISVPSPTPTPVATPTSSPSATPPPVASGSLTPPYAGKVVFFSRRNAGELNLMYVMNPDGSQVTQINPITLPLPAGVGYDRQFTDAHYMNAAGTKFLLTFSSANNVNILVNADGTGQKDITKLLDPDATETATYSTGQVFGVSMNADGTQFVFPYNVYANESSTSTLVTMNADGTERTTRYTVAGSDLVRDPIFAPDGKTLYFVQYAPDSDTGTDQTIYGSIYRLAAGASTPTLVTSFVTEDTTRIAIDGLNPNNEPVGLTTISINADGTKLAFAKDPTGLGVSPVGNEVFTVNTDGTGLKQLTTTGPNVDPAFTADGTKIIFVSYRDGNDELYSMNPDGTNQTRLTYEIEPDVQPATRAAKQSALPQSATTAHTGKAAAR